jgi:hypothetical protein
MAASFHLIPTAATKGDSTTLGSPNETARWYSQNSMSRKTKVALNTVYALAALQFLRFYVTSTHLWVNLPHYLAGTDRLPFQKRILPVPLLLAFNKLLGRFPILDQGQAVFTPEKFSLFCVATVAFAVAAFYLMRFYRAVSPTRLLEVLVLPCFIVICLFTYVVHIGDTLSYPYDLPSVAVFTAGLYYIYERRFLPLVAVMLIGTFNRETTLFLIGLYLIDAASVDDPAAIRLRDRISLRNLPWLRAGLLLLIWAVIEVGLTRHFAQNDHSEEYLRIHENLGYFRPRMWPALLNIGAYSLPLILLHRRHLQPTRLANYLLILPAWFAVMFIKGTLTETRIYGELTAYFAIATVLLLEQNVRSSLGNIRGAVAVRKLDAKEAGDFIAA